MSSSSCARARRAALVRPPRVRWWTSSAHTPASARARGQTMPADDHPFVRDLRRHLVADAHATDVRLALQVFALTRCGYSHGQIATRLDVSTAAVNAAA